MKKIIFLLFLTLIGKVSAQKYRGDYNEWSIEFNAGLNKPYHTMSSGYATTSPNLFHIDLGTRYTINPFIGIKADFGYDSFKNKNNTLHFKTDYIRFDIQAVGDVGYTLGLYDRPIPFGILFHAGTGVSQFTTDIDRMKERMVNFIFGFTGTYEISNNVTLAGDISNLLHLRQETNFDGRSSNSASSLNGNLLTSTLGIIYYFR